MPNERGPVGGAGELTAQDVLEAANSVDVRLHSNVGNLAAPARLAVALNRALAAKAPQGVAAATKEGRREGIRTWLLGGGGGFEGTPEASNFSFEGLIDHIDAFAELACNELTARLNDGSLALAAPPAPALPVPGPVSDTTIHHGMFPPAPSGAAQYEKAPIGSTRTIIVGPDHEDAARIYTPKGEINAYWVPEIEGRTAFVNIFIHGDLTTELEHLVQGTVNPSMAHISIGEAAAPKPAAPKPAAPADDIDRLIAEAAQPEYQERLKRVPGPVQGPGRSQGEARTSSPNAGASPFAAGPAPGAERLLEALETIVAVASGEKQVADDDTAGMAWIDKFAREALAAAPPAATNDHELLVGGVVRVALELAILRGDLRMDNGDAFEEMSESEREDVISDTWNAMNGEGTCDGGQVKELKAIYAALARDRHASAERVRQLVAKWRKQAANISELIPVSVEVQSMGKSCAEHADELERALPPSTGEKS